MSSGKSSIAMILVSGGLQHSAVVTMRLKIAFCLWMTPITSMPISKAVENQIRTLPEYDYRFQSLSNLVQFRTARLSHTHCSYGEGAT